MESFLINGLFEVAPALGLVDLDKNPEDEASMLLSRSDFRLNNDVERRLDVVSSDGARVERGRGVGGATAMRSREGEGLVYKSTGCVVEIVTLSATENLRFGNEPDVLGRSPDNVKEGGFHCLRVSEEGEDTRGSLVTESRDTEKRAAFSTSDEVVECSTLVFPLSLE